MRSGRERKREVTRGGRGRKKNKKGECKQRGKEEIITWQECQIFKFPYACTWIYENHYDKHTDIMYVPVQQSPTPGI